MNHDTTITKKLTTDEQKVIRQQEIATARRERLERKRQHEIDDQAKPKKKRATKAFRADIGAPNLE